MRPSPHLDTTRLRLRPPADTDAAAIYAYGHDSEVTRFLSWPTHTGPSDAQAFIRRAGQSWRDGTDFPYVIELAGKVVGATNLEPRGAGLWRTGYVLRKEAWGKGVATEALSAVVHEAWSMGATALEAVVHPENHASIRVLEKVGFRETGFGPRAGALPNLGVVPDVHTYTIYAR
jgi:RimJ/RimL family protein N-acetyltransferase